ncbi:MAG: glycoside hydrolase family 5 protein [Chloroflexaceae bacterium]|jgi:hypothetical protein|nr:glycoside hydrolase family 5 protein [Chloroflexaceae bacterium]
MQPFRFIRSSGPMLVLLLLLPLLAACAGDNNNPQASGPTAVPTAAVVGTPNNQAAPTVAPGSTTAPTAPTAAPATPRPGPADTTFPLKTPYLEFGVVAHLYYTDRDRVMTLASNAGFDWVRQQIYWRDVEDPAKNLFVWDEVDAIVESVNKSGRKLLVNIVRTPAAYNPTGGLPSDPTTFGNFVEQMAKRYGNKIAAYEIWNEPNLAHETGGRITTDDVGTYVELLIEAYKRIKAVSPDAFVLAAASSSTGVTDANIALSDEDFYRAMYSYRDGIVKDYFDVQAVHPGGTLNPPDTLWPDNPGPGNGCPDPEQRCWQTHPTFYFRHVENVRKWMEEYGLGDRQIWLTEFGWATQNNSPGFEYGNAITMEMQAEYVAGAFQYAYDNYPWMGAMFLWNMNFAVTKAENNLDTLHEQASFGILNPDWSPRPSFLASQSLIAQLKQQQGR